MHMVQEQKSISSIKHFVASITWLHQLGGYPDPSTSAVVTPILQSAYRQLAKPTVHKNPLTKDILQNIHDSMFPPGSPYDLLKLRNFSYILISFTGFLRFEEASNIKRHNLHIMHDYLIIDITRSKTDPFKQGNQVYIARSSSDLCTLTWLVRYLHAASIKNTDKCFVFRNIFRNIHTGKTGLRTQNQPMSYTCLSEMFQQCLSSAGHDNSNYSLHSLRAGGVTLAAASGVADKMYKAHGRWKSNAVEAYVQETTSNKLSVTKALDL